jgi:hypothetical protein
MQNEGGWHKTDTKIEIATRLYPGKEKLRYFWDLFDVQNIPNPYVEQHVVVLKSEFKMVDQSKLTIFFADCRWPEQQNSRSGAETCWDVSTSPHLNTTFTRQISDDVTKWATAFPISPRRLFGPFQFFLQKWNIRTSKFPRQERISTRQTLLISPISPAHWTHLWSLPTFVASYRAEISGRSWCWVKTKWLGT